MTINITMPELNSTSTKDKVISILSRTWPLTTKEIYNALQREYGCEISYQAVHKLISQLQTDGVMVKNGKGLAISKDWISKVKNFGNVLDSKYSNGEIDYENFNGSIHLTLNNFVDLGRFLINDFFIKFPNEKNKDCVCFWKHHYPATGVSDVEHENMKKIFSTHVHYGLSKCDTFLDKYFGNYLTGLGKKNMCGVDFTTTIDTFIMGDFICHVYFEPSFYKEVEAIYDSAKSQDDVDFAKIFEIVSKKTEINVLITRNASLADKLREEAKEIFGEDK